MADCVKIEETRDGVWAHFHIPGGRFHYSINLSATQGDMGRNFAIEYSKFKASSEAEERRRNAFDTLPDDFEAPH